MRYASGHNYRNSLFIVDVATGRYHIPQNVFLVSIKVDKMQLYNGDKVNKMLSCRRETALQGAL